MEERNQGIVIRVYGRRKFLGLSKLRAQASTNISVTPETRIPTINEYLSLDLGDCTKIKLNVKKIETATILRPPFLSDEVGSQYKTPALVILYCYASKKTLLALQNRKNWQYAISKLEI